MTSFKVFLGLSCFSMPVSSVKAAVQVLEENWERGKFTWFDIVE